MGKEGKEEEEWKNGEVQCGVCEGAREIEVTMATYLPLRAALRW